MYLFLVEMIFIIHFINHNSSHIFPKLCKWSFFLLMSTFIFFHSKNLDVIFIAKLYFTSKLDKTINQIMKHCFPA